VDVNSLPDPLARNANLSESALATDADRATKPEWLILVGVCTHLGCTPQFPHRRSLRANMRLAVPLPRFDVRHGGTIRKVRRPRNLDVAGLHLPVLTPAVKVG